MTQGSSKLKLTAAVAVVLTATTIHADANQTRIGFETVNGIKPFYREAGDPESPSIVMLHGFPSSSHQYRNLIRSLSDAYHVVAPDYPGFGSSDAPSPDSFSNTYDAHADHVDTFIEQRGITEYALVLQDYGAPVGFRVAVEHPERVTALLVQNGNAYVEGVSTTATETLQALWGNRTPEVDAQIAARLFSVEALQWQYTHGTRDPGSINPDNWNLDFLNFQRPGTKANMLALLYD